MFPVGLPSSSFLPTNFERRSSLQTECWRKASPPSRSSTTTPFGGETNVSYLEPAHAQPGEVLEYVCRSPGETVSRGGDQPVLVPISSCETHIAYFTPTTESVRVEPTWSAIHTNPFELVSLHFLLVTSAFKRDCLRTVFCGGLPDVAVHSECRPRYGCSGNRNQPSQRDLSDEPTAAAGGIGTRRERGDETGDRLPQIIAVPRIAYAAWLSGLVVSVSWVACASL